MAAKEINIANNITISPLKLCQCKKASELMWRVFLEFEAPIYTPMGNRLFKQFISPFSIFKNMLSGTLYFYGAYLQDTLVGIMAVRENHISLLFISKEQQRQGIGRMLVQTYLKDYIDYQSTKSSFLNYITVHSSPFGLHFYKKLGFFETDKAINEDGIIYTPMRKIINIVINY